MIEQPGIIQGARHEDARGTLSFINDFAADEVKRFYIAGHPDTSVIRAWQGHKNEQKWFCAIQGSFKIVLLRPDNWEQPSEELPVQEFTLTWDNMQILHIPKGYITGFKALEAGSRLMIFSDRTLQQSLEDDYRYDPELWYTWH